MKENALPDGSEYRCGLCHKTFGELAFTVKHLAAKHVAEFESFVRACAHAADSCP